MLIFCSKITFGLTIRWLIIFHVFQTKVRVRLSNPLPKTQAVKGGMCGGFRIGQARTETNPRSGSFVIPVKFNLQLPWYIFLILITTAIGRGIARGGQAFNRGNFSRDRSFFHGGRGQMGRMGFRNDLDVNNTFPDFHQRQFGFRGCFLMFLFVFFVTVKLLSACLCIMPDYKYITIFLL